MKMWGETAGSPFLPAVLKGDILPVASHIIDHDQIWVSHFHTGKELGAPVGFAQDREALQVLQNEANRLGWLLRKVLRSKSLLLGHPGVRAIDGVP